MTKEQNLFPLKLLVYSLGVLLLGGVVLLFALVLSKEGKLSARPSCMEAAVDLPNGEVMAVYPDGRNLRIWLKKDPNHSEVLTVDACTGALLGRLSLSAGERPPQP